MNTKQEDNIARPSKREIDQKKSQCQANELKGEFL